MCTFEQTSLNHCVHTYCQTVGSYVWVLSSAKGRAVLPLNTANYYLPPLAGLLIVVEVPMSQADHGPQKILLCVDDSPSILEYERRLFERSGYTVVTAESPRRGLRLVTLFAFDAVLVDYWMPEMNGHQFAYEIRRLRPETPIVMCSSSEIPEETRLLVDAFVSKNVAHRELLPTVTRICDRPMTQ